MVGANAKLILFSGEAFDAVRASQLGLVSETVPDDTFEGRAEVLVQALRGSIAILDPHA